MTFLETFLDLYVRGGRVSDKGTTHDYISKWYSPEFTPRKEESLTIVEIGVFRGDGVRLLKDWFTNARVVGIDPLIQGSFKTGVPQSTREELLVHKDIEFIFEDAYQTSVVNRFDDESVDYVIDDGPHTVETQLWCIEYYYPKIKKGGTIVIEDIQDLKNDREKFEELANKMNLNMEILTDVGPKFDSVLIIIRK